MGKWEFYKDTQGLWLWLRRDPSDQVLDRSGESFMTLDECKEHARRRGWGGTREMPPIVDETRIRDDLRSPDDE